MDSYDLVDVDIIDDGEYLKTIPDSSQDFVIANHFLEHCQNPIGAMINMLRVLKNGGVLCLAIPDKRFTFDFDCPSTSLEHIMKDFEDGPVFSKLQHYKEWVRLVDNIEDDVTARERVETDMISDCF